MQYHSQRGRSDHQRLPRLGRWILPWLIRNMEDYLPSRRSAHHRYISCGVLRAVCHHSIQINVERN